MTGDNFMATDSYLIYHVPKDRKPSSQPVSVEPKLLDFESLYANKIPGTRNPISRM
jgi:hypothetical protein